MGTRSRVGRPVFWLASFMFFLSGGTGLAYQVIWFKRLAHVWGSSSLAFASVSASFLFGLGLGAYLIGRRVDRLDRPLRGYGLCELAIGVLALVIPFEIQWLIGLAASYSSHLPDAPLWRYVVQSAVTLLVVGPPCVLMGGTLPLLIRELTAREGPLDQATGWLYAINTFGAAAGCLLAGFYLLPRLGLLWTNRLAAALNLAIGVCSIVASRRASGRRGSATTAAPQADAGPPIGSLRPLFVAVPLSGLGALILEMAWGRQLALSVGGSTYAYSAALFVVLLGIAAGSLIFHLGLRRVASWPFLPAAAVGILALGCLLGAARLPQLAEYMGLHRINRITFGGNALICVSAAIRLELLPSLAMGILFPLFVHLTHRTAAAAGRTVGDVYAWNTFGSIAGASLTAVWLFPSIGTAGSVALATALYVGALVVVLPWRSAGQRITGLASLLAGAAVVACLLIPVDPRRTNLGMYLYGVPKDLSRHEMLFFAEGPSSNVLVTRQNERKTSLRFNGKIDASDDFDMTTQLGLAYFPRVLKPDAADVLVIGYGSGTTPGASLLFPRTNVTCCEIEPAVYEASRCFAHVNHEPNRQDRFRMVLADGRSFLQGSRQKYDLILSEPSSPWLSGMSNLFTTEFFEAARRHLKPGGVLAQWIQTYNFSIADYLMIVRTLATRFPHYGVLVLSDGADTILLGSEQPLQPTQAGIEHAQTMVDASPAMTSDLRHRFGTTDLRALLMRFYLVDQTALRAAVDRGVPVLNTDLNLRLEFVAPLHLYQPPAEERDALTQLLALSSESWRSNLGRSLGITPNSAAFEIAEAQYALQSRKVDEARTHYRNALARDPKPVAAWRGLATLEVQASRQPEALEALRKALEVDPRDQESLRMLAKLLVAEGNVAEGVATYEKLLAVNPTDEEALGVLASSKVGEGRLEESIEILQRLKRVAPRNPTTHGHLGDLYLKLGRKQEAATAYREALQLSWDLSPESENLSWANNLAWLLATDPQPEIRNGKEAVRWAKRACEAVDYDQIQLMDTLAAAYAEAGDFGAAIDLIRKCVARAEREGHGESAETYRSRLRLYQQRQPYREA